MTTVKVTASDLEADVLAEKLTAGEGVTLTVEDVGGVQTLRIDIPATVSTGGGPDGYQIYLDSSDATPGFLLDKLVAGDNITFDTDDVGGNRTVTLNVANSLTDTVGPDGYQVKVSVSDTTPEFLADKLVAGSNITITQQDIGGVETLLFNVADQVTTISQGPDGYRVKSTDSDTSPDFLFNKLASGENISINLVGDCIEISSASVVSGGGIGEDGYTVKVNAGDNTPGFLFNKLEAGSNVTLTETEVGGDYSVRISVPDSLSVAQFIEDGYQLKVTAGDSQPDFLADKLTAGEGIVLETVDIGGNNQAVEIRVAPSVAGQAGEIEDIQADILVIQGDIVTINTELDGLTVTVQEHYDGQNIINRDIINSLDGYTSLGFENDLLPGTDDVWNIGSPDKKWRDGYFSHGINICDDINFKQLLYNSVATFRDLSNPPNLNNPPNVISGIQRHPENGWLYVLAEGGDGYPVLWKINPLTEEREIEFDFVNSGPPPDSYRASEFRFITNNSNQTEVFVSRSSSGAGRIKADGTWETLTHPTAINQIGNGVAIGDLGGDDLTHIIGQEDDRVYLADTGINKGIYYVDIYGTGVVTLITGLLLPNGNTYLPSELNNFSETKVNTSAFGIDYNIDIWDGYIYWVDSYGAGEEAVYKGRTDGTGTTGLVIPNIPFGVESISVRDEGIYLCATETTPLFFYTESDGLTKLVGNLNDTWTGVFPEGQTADQPMVGAGFFDTDAYGNYWFARVNDNFTDTVVFNVGMDYITPANWSFTLQNNPGDYWSRGDIVLQDSYQEAARFIFGDNSNLGIGAFPHERLTVEGGIALRSLDNSLDPTDGYGKVYVRGSELYFLDPQGNETQLGLQEDFGPIIDEHYAQHSQAIDTIRARLDGYASDTTVSEHYAQLSTVDRHILGALDGYNTFDDDLSEQVTTIQLGLDGYVSQSDYNSYTDGVDSTLHNITDAADAYGEVAQQVTTIQLVLDGYASDATVSEHYNQLSSGLETVISELDGYDIWTRSSDGYVGLNTSTPHGTLDINGIGGAPVTIRVRQGPDDPEVVSIDAGETDARLTVLGGAASVRLDPQDYGIHIGSSSSKNTYIRWTDDGYQGGFIRKETLNGPNGLIIGVHQNTDQNIADDIDSIYIRRNDGHVAIGVSGSYPQSEVLSVDGRLQLSVQSAGVSSPDTGWGKLYIAPDGDLKFQAESGTEYNLLDYAAGGATSNNNGIDGYIAFFTGPNSIAGDNDLFWNRTENKLILNNLQIPLNANNGWVLTSDNSGNARWQPGGSGGSADFNLIVVDEDTDRVVVEEDPVTGELNVVSDE